MSKSILKNFRLGNMLISLPVFSLWVIFSSHSYAQNAHIQGVWVNSYGSIMKVEMQGNRLK